MRRLALVRQDERPPYSAELVVRLTRSWRCDVCERSIRRGAQARVRIVAGEPRNRVTHLDCGGQRDEGRPPAPV